ncbi:MAG: hypothetical protein CMP68_05220 [Flavobacteriales bacterium]|nr:hypothetical protein [Flavobacteriales bacterium]
MKIKKKYYLFVPILITMFLVNSFFTTSQNLDETYIVLRKFDKVEIREYKPLLYVAYSDKEKKSGQNSYFRVLADYIFGANETNEKIAMTSPVVIKLHNEREMLFRMPKKYNKKNIPKPNNKDIDIVFSEKVLKATIRYSGYTNEQKEQRMIKELKNILLENNISHDNKFELLVYDPPYRLINRRNEISVRIK